MLWCGGLHTRACVSFLARLASDSTLAGRLFEIAGAWYPFLMCPGNHEVSSGEEYQPYNVRYPMPRAAFKLLFASAHFIFHFHFPCRARLPPRFADRAEIQE